MAIFTLGDALVTFNPFETGPLRYVQSFSKKAGGAELNFAIGCARLGLQTKWMSRLGNDEFGKGIVKFARGEGIDMSAVELVAGYPTSLNFNGSFAETSHFTSDGSIDINGIVKALYDQNYTGYARPDHGRHLWGEVCRPGYGLYDRALGIMYLNGLWDAYSNIKGE